MPSTRWVKPFHYADLLLTALAFWMVSFGLIWLTGLLPANALIAILLAFCLIALAEVIHAPAAMAIVGELSPLSTRGIYFSLESQGWSLGFLIGPALGGWVLDRGSVWSSNLWLGLMASTLVSAILVVWLKYQSKEDNNSVISPVTADGTSLMPKKISPTES